MKANKVLVLCFGFALTTISSLIIPAEAQREGESPADYAVRIGEIEGKKRAQEIKNEPLSLLEDYSYIKYYGGYKKFYDTPKSHFLGLSKGKMKTFFEEWMQEGITYTNISAIREAYDRAIAFKIPLNTQLLDQATSTVRKLLDDGMIFLTRTLPPKEVHAIGHNLKKIADSAH